MLFSCIFSVTEKFYPTIQVFEHLRYHEVGELIPHQKDRDHFMNVMRKFVMKSKYSHGLIRERGDPIGALWNFYPDHLPEKWYEYYWKEQYYGEMGQINDWMHNAGENYDPLYIHDHH
jgi:hypothetical protein